MQNISGNNVQAFVMIGAIAVMTVIVWWIRRMRTQDTMQELRRVAEEAERDRDRITLQIDQIHATLSDHNAQIHRLDERSK